MLPPCAPFKSNVAVWTPWGTVHDCSPETNEHVTTKFDPDATGVPHTGGVSAAAAPAPTVSSTEATATITAISRSRSARIPRLRFTVTDPPTEYFFASLT